MAANTNKRTTEELPLDTSDTPSENTLPQSNAAASIDDTAASDTDESGKDAGAAAEDATDPKPLDTEEEPASVDPEAAPAFVMADDDDDTADADDAVDADDVGDADDHNCTAEFQAAATVPGEFLLPVRDLNGWEYHLRRFSPLKTTHSAALALSAADPLHLRPILVLKKDGKYVVVDGRFILEAIKSTHPGNGDLLVRVELFEGTEQQAVAKMCDTALGSAVATSMEAAQGLLALQRANRISQVTLAERYAGLTKDKVSQKLIAARLQESYPVLYELLEEPHKAPISLGVALNKAVKQLPRAEFVELIARAKQLVADGERCTPAALFDVLGIDGQRGGLEAAASNALDTHDDTAEPAEPKAGPARLAKLIEAIESEPIDGHDDKPIGAYERLADGYFRIRLPHVTADTPLIEREAGLEACVKHLRRHFELDQHD